MNKKTVWMTAGVAAVAIALGGTTVAIAATSTPSASIPVIAEGPTSTPSATPRATQSATPSVTPTTPSATPSATPTSTTSNLALAKAAAIAATGGGTVIEAETDDNVDYAYEITVRLADGTVTEVKLTSTLTVFSIEADDDGHHGDDATDDSGHHGGRDDSDDGDDDDDSDNSGHGHGGSDDGDNSGHGSDD